MFPAIAGEGILDGKIPQLIGRTVIIKVDAKRHKIDVFGDRIRRQSKIVVISFAVGVK